MRMRLVDAAEIDGERQTNANFQHISNSQEMDTSNLGEHQ
jgi:hypothetical protein